MGRFWQLVLMGCLAAVALRGEDSGPVAEADGQDYGFEGTIDRMDARFAPDLREGLVVAGLYAFVGGLDSEDLDESLDKAVYPNAVANAELTIDRNHVWVYGAEAGRGDGGLELTRGIANGDRRFDLYAVTLPLNGAPIGDAGWTPRWLQLWLYGPEKEMFTSLRAQPPPESFTRGWWRITFWNEEGSESAVAEGRLTASGEAGAELNPSEQIAALEGVVVDLNRQLDAAEQRVFSLESELNTTRKRVGALQSTIDLLVDERENLRSEVSRLQEAQNETPKALEKRVAELEAGEVIWEEREDAWKGQNRVMAEALSEAEREVAQLQRALARAERDVAQAEGAPPAAAAVSVPAPEPTPPVPGPIIIVPTPQTVSAVRKTPRPSAEATIPPATAVETRPLPVAATPTMATRVPAAKPEPVVEKSDDASEERNFVPRAGKFRRGRR